MTRLLARIFLPFQRAVEVTVIMHSGRALVFTATKFEFSRSPITGAIVRVVGSRTVGFPLYLDHSRIESITTRRVWRWRA